MFGRKAEKKVRTVRIIHVHQPDAKRTLYAYCRECRALITCATANGMQARPNWRRTNANRARVLAGPRWGTL